MGHSTSQKVSDEAISQYAGMQEQAHRWAGPAFMKNFKLEEEPAELRQAYGGEFGQVAFLRVVLFKLEFASLKFPTT